MYLFDEQQLRRNLREMKSAFRMAFAATCAERLRSAAMSAGQIYDERVTDLHQAVADRLVNLVRGAVPPKQEFERLLLLCMELMPSDEDATEDEGEMLRVDAIAALAYALRTVVSGDAQDAVWAARRAYEAADRRALKALTVPLQASDAEVLVLAHPAVQRELSRQARDMDVLSKLTPGSSASRALEELFSRAMAEGPSFLEG